MKWRLAYNTNGFMNTTLEDAIERIAKFGYDGVEIFADVPHAHLLDFSKSRLQKVKGIIKRTGLEVAGINACTMRGIYGDALKGIGEFLLGPCFTSVAKHDREARIKNTKSAIDFAVELEAGCVNTLSGGLMIGGPPELAMEWFVDGLTECVDYAKDRGMKMAIENEPGTISANTWEILEVLEKVGSPWLGANLDIGHIYVAGEDVAEAVKNLGKRIFYIHVDDIKDGKHYHRIPGTGDVDFQSFVKALEQINYDGFLSVELYTFGLGKLEESDRAAEKSIKYLKLI